jgi:hypothetical protein
MTFLLPDCIASSQSPQLIQTSQSGCVAQFGGSGRGRLWRAPFSKLCRSDRSGHAWPATSDNSLLLPPEDQAAHQVWGHASFPCPRQSGAAVLWSATRGVAAQARFADRPLSVASTDEISLAMDFFTTATTAGSIMVLRISQFILETTTPPSLLP